MDPLQVTIAVEVTPNEMEVSEEFQGVDEYGSPCPHCIIVINIADA